MKYLSFFYYKIGVFSGERQLQFVKPKAGQNGCTTAEATTWDHDANNPVII
jgi:hypothetical protein